MPRAKGPQPNSAGFMDQEQECVFELVLRVKARGRPDKLRLDVLHSIARLVGFGFPDAEVKRIREIPAASAVPSDE